MKEVNEDVMLPEGSILLDEGQMICVEGGGLSVTAVVKALATVAAADYGAFYAIGQRFGYKYSSDDYKKIKWPLRAAVLGSSITIGGLTPPVWGGIALLGFENGFYSTK